MAWYNYFTIEIPMMLMLFSFILQAPIMTNLFVYRTCYVILQYNKSDCAQLGKNINNITKVLEPKVQPTVNQINMANNVINTFLPMIFCLFLGTWSDKFGRRPFMIACFVGALMNQAVNVIIIHFKDLSPWWFTMGSIPSMLTGGFGALMIINNAHLIDVTTEKNRIVRLTVFGAVSSVSSAIANLVSSYIFYATSYQTIYLIGLTLNTLASVYVFFFIPESLKEEKKSFSIEEIMNSINVKDIIKYTIRKRKNNARFYLFWLICIHVLNGLAMGEMSVFTLYLRASKLQWTLTKITLVQSAVSFGGIFGNLFVTYVLHKFLHIKDMWLVILGIIMRLVGNLLRGFATNDYYIYAAYVANFFDSFPMLMLTMVLAKMVSPEEMGKILALISVISSLVNMLSNVLYPLVYNATIDSFIGLFNFVSFGFNVISGLAIIFLLRVNLPHFCAVDEQQDNEPSAKRMSLAEAAATNEWQACPSVQTYDLNMKKLSITTSVGENF
ncbi:unnamed protein product [Phyllotreta striolata]|uniref:Major facilitator superfamily (MFS) profile domain-containing protein n=1 Tax=Phyllotreta striolata TaxID=444603 RepID=A0A9N9TIY9_PHYSR|nr:unnamed protein product [Phyllotreta striolata]